MDKYYINWSSVSGNYLVKKVGEEENAGKILQIFLTKEKAEKFIKELVEKENIK